MSSDQEHIELVSLKIGLAETDEQLENILLKFLAPIIKKLQSTDSGVRTKVMSLLTHINKRLKARESIQLPVESLIHQFNDETMNSFVTNFSIVYMKTGFKRLEADKKLQLLPLLFISIKGKVKTQQNALLRLIAENLALASFDNATTRPWFEEFKFEENEEQLDVLLDYFLEVLIMPYSTSLKAAIGSSSTSDEILIPGLSKNSIRRLLGDVEEDHWSLDKIEQIKMAILKFIKLEFVDANKTVAHLVVASSDTRFAVATNADMQLRNSLAVIKWSDEKMTMSLYRIYLGFAADLLNRNKASEDKVQPANMRIKMKLMQYLLRCPVATELFPHNIQVVYDGLFAASNIKLKTLALQFMHYIFDNAGIDKLTKQAPMLLNAAIKVVTERGEDSSRIQGLAYTSVTKLAGRLPQLFAEKFDLLQQFIDSLGTEEATDVKQSIVEATTSMIPAFSDLSDEKINLFRPLVDKSMSNKDHHIRMVGVRYAAGIFGDDDVDSRYMLLLSTSDPKEEVATEASDFIRIGLKSGKMPSFQLMLNYVSLKADERLHSRYAYSIGVQSLAFHPKAFKAIIKFVFHCLLKQCGVCFGEEDEEFDTNPQQPLEFNLSAVVDYVKGMLASDGDKACMLMNKLLRLMVDYSSLVPDSFVLNLMLKTAEATCHLMSVEQLFENSNPRSKTMSKSKCMEWAEHLAYHTREETSYLGAELFSLLFSHDQPSAEKYIALLRKQGKNLTSKTHEEQHGAMLTLAYLLGDYLSWSHHSGTADDVELKNYMSGLVIQLGEIANTSIDQNLVAAACFAIGEIARKSPLPLPEGDAESDDVESDEVKFTKPATKLDFVLLLRNRLKTKFGQRVRQRAAMALGRLPVGEKSFAHTALITQALLDTSKTKDTERHFVIGEALINCALGPLSVEAVNKWTGKPIHLVALLEDSQAQEQEDDGMDVDLEHSKGMEELLNRILNEYVEHRLPSARQASCIWLTKILTAPECTRLSTISKHLIKIQTSFTSLIVESDELTQDLASKGLCLVYELGDQSQKEKLVSDLVESLTGNSPGTSQTVRIMGDESQKFFKEVKQKKSSTKVEGPALLLYKEMCSLASDLNRPELVYKFLYLQNHHLGGGVKKTDDPTNVRVHSSNQQRKTGVDYKSVVQSTREQLKPLHKQIIPRLYRNTFDPQPNVRTAMTSIWNVICPEPTKSISAHLPLIVQELLTGLTHMLWRNRQASCLAFIDLFRVGVSTQMQSDENGKTVAVEGNPIVDKLAEIWSTALRVQDDMKESVRDAATKLCRSLQKVTLKLIDPKQSSRMKETVLNDVINVLLKEGMLSRVQESRGVSINTLVEVSKVSGEVIKPCISVLVVSLLEALSDVEPREINYLRNRSEQVTQDKLDWIRAEYIKSTPMMETAVRCLKHYDSSVLDELVPALAELTKRGVGVPTKAGCAYFACQLVSVCGSNLTPYAGKLLKVFVSGLRDTSLAIRKVNSSAVGNLSRVAKDASVSRSIEKFKEWYLRVDDTTSRHASASAIYAIARHSPDTMQRHLAELMPLAFYAMHGKVVTNESNSAAGANSPSADVVTKNDDQSFDISPKEMFEAIWNEFTPGSETAVRIYLDEIVTLAAEALSSQNWESKAQAAKTMSSVARYQTSQTIQSAHLNRLIEALVGGLRGRHWVGKNYLLSALKDLLKHHGCDLDKETVEKPAVPDHINYLQLIVDGKAVWQENLFPVEISSRQRYIEVLDSLLAESGRSKDSGYRCEALVCYGEAAAALRLDKYLPLWESALRLISPGKNVGSDSEDEQEDSKSTAKEEMCRSMLPVVDGMWTVTDAQMRAEHGDRFLTLVVDTYLHGTYQTRVVCLSSIVSFLESVLDQSGGEMSDFSYVHSKLFQVLLQSLGDLKHSHLRQKGAAVVTLLCRLSKAGAPFSSSGEFEQLSDVLKQQITVCGDLTSTAENMDALEHMRNALGGIEEALEC